MKFLLIVVFCKVGFSLAQEKSYWDRYGEEATAGDEGATDEPTGDWGARGDDDVLTTTPPMSVRKVFDIKRWDVFDLVDIKVLADEGTNASTSLPPRFHYRFNFASDVEKHIPELCYMTLENITIFNSYLLDKQCLEEFESVSPQCRGFRCNAVRYFLEHGARIYMDVINAPSLKEGLEVVNREILAAFQKLEMCTCGRQFFKAAFKCAPYWQANALYDLTEFNSGSIISYYKFAWNIDVESFSKVFDRLLAGFCEESSHGMCINSIVNGLEEMMDLVTTTMEDYEDYDDGNRDFQKSQEKRCDALFGPIRSWTKNDRYLEYFEWDYFDSGYDVDYYNEQVEEQIELFLNKTAAVSKAFYCKRGCRNDESRTAMYPCCLRKILEDKKLFDNIARAAESLYKITPATDLSEMDLWNYFGYLYYSREVLQKRANWTVPARMRDAVMRTLHAAKYCDGKILRCSK